MDFEEVKPQLRKEINSALLIWTDLLPEFLGDNLSYVYTKGSAVKEWNSSIDYVPVVSDVDIHYGVHDKTKLFELENPRKASLDVSLEYEKRFNRENPNKIHLPRMQVICTDNLSDQVTFVHPIKSSVKMLFGTFPDYSDFSLEIIKEIDRNNLNELKPYLNRLPDGYLDKVGLDYWSSLRTLTWKVSPSPVRILTQLLPDPMNIWTWNRSKILEELRKLELISIAEMYEKYYASAWQLFKSNMSETIDFQNCLLTGSKVLELCYDWYTQYTTNNRM